MRTKISITLPSELIEEIKTLYPTTPLSAAITLLLERTIHGPADERVEPTHDLDPVTTSGLFDMIRSVIRDEMSRGNQAYPSPAVHSPKVEYSTEQVDPDAWYTNGKAAEFLPARIPASTRRSRISKAVATGILETNGARHIHCAIAGHSLIAWLKDLDQ